MKELTQDDVFKYAMGLMTDPDERRAVEHAREYDPLVRYWFSVLADESLETPPEACQRAGEKIAGRVFDTGPAGSVPTESSEVYDRVTRVRGGYEYQLMVLKEGRADDGKPSERRDTTRRGDTYTVDAKAGEIRFTYPASEVPYGVARVTRKEAGVAKGEILVAFREWGAEPNLQRQAVVKFADLGIPATVEYAPHLYVEFARDGNLAEFPVEKVRSLRERCNGDRELRAAVDLLLAKL